MNPQDIIPITGFAEPVSSLTHLGGAVIALFMGGFLLRRAGSDFGKLASLFVFCASCVVLFSASGVYHLLDFGTPGRDFMQRVDHAAIFMLIAGTCTPAQFILFKGMLRWGVLILVWALAILGIVLKLVWFEVVSEQVGLFMYIGLGWLAAVSGLVYWHRHGTKETVKMAWPLFAGGLFYTFGAILEFLRVPILIPGVLGPHELFHIAVILGAGSHWYFLYSISRELIPKNPRYA